MANRNSTLLLKIFILLPKLKKPLVRKLVSLKKMKKLKLLGQYSYFSYIKECEFSSSSTPLIEFRRMPKNGRMSLKKLYSDLVLICRSFTGSRKKEMYRLELMGLDSSLVCAEESAGEMVAELSSSEDDDNSVDERAEKFIQSFYEEMRRQRSESNSHLLLQN